MVNGSLNIQGDSSSLLTIDSGSSTLEDLVDKTFYGLKVNRYTGQAYIDVILGDAPIVLPNTELVTSESYINWMWSYNTLRYYFNNTGRLIMEVL